MKKDTNKQHDLETKILFVNLIKSGDMTITHAAKVLSVSKSCIHDWVKKESQGNLSPKKKVDMRDLVNYVNSREMTHRDIAKHFGVSYTHISNLMRKYGIVKRYVIPQELSEYINP